MSDPNTPEGYPPNPGLPRLPAARPPQPQFPPAPAPQSPPPPAAAVPPPAAAVPPPAAAVPPSVVPPPAAPPATVPTAQPPDAAARSHRSPELPPPEPSRPAPQPAAASQEDAAARFRKPAPAPAAAATPAPIESGEAPGLGELAERALTALMLGHSAYAPLATRPAPSYGTMTLLALGFAALALALNAALTAVAQPALLGRYPAWFYAAVTAGALGISLAWLLLSATVLFALGKALGGKAGFERGYLAASMLFALAPVQSLASLLPYAWLAPSLLFAWAGAGALAGLLGAGFPGALTVCSMLAALSIAGQGVARAVYAKSQQVLAQSQALMTPGGAADAAALMQAVRQMQQLQAGGGAPAPVIGDMGEAPAGEGQAPASAPGGSSLDLLRGDGEGGPQRGPSRAEQAQMLQQGDALRVQAVAMLESTLPMMENPAITKGLDAQGKKDLAELKTLLTRLKSQASTDAKISDQEFDATMQKIQAMSMRVMAAGMSGAGQAGKAPASQPAAGEKR